MLDKICTDLETSKELERLGVQLITLKISNFNAQWVDGEIYSNYECERYDFGSHDKKEQDEWCPAYTLEEILEMLPNCIWYLKIDKLLISYSHDKEFGGGDTFLELDKKDNENLATAAAKLVIKLKEYKII